MQSESISVVKINPNTNRNVSKPFKKEISNILLLNNYLSHAEVSLVIFFLLSPFLSYLTESAFRPKYMPEHMLLQIARESYAKDITYNDTYL